MSFFFFPFFFLFLFFFLPNAIHFRRRHSRAQVLPALPGLTSPHPFLGSTQGRCLIINRVQLGPFTYLFIFFFSYFPGRLGTLSEIRLKK